MAIEIKEEWYPMPPNLGPPLPRSMQVYWPWVERPPEEEVPAPPAPPEAPPTVKYRLYIYTVGTGTVTPTDGEYPSGTVVTLTARPGADSAFDHWAGDAAGTSPTVNITMDRSKSVTAYFTTVTPSPEVPPPPSPPPPEEPLPEVPPPPSPPPPAPPKAEFYMPPQLEVPSLYTTEIVGYLYHRITYACTITNNGDAAGTYRIDWQNFWNGTKFGVGHEVITLGPGESYRWSKTVDVDFGRCNTARCELRGDWEENNYSERKLVKGVPV